MQTEILKVTGMSCGGCVGTIERARKAIPAVSTAKVSLANHEATVQFSEGQPSGVKPTCAGPLLTAIWLICLRFAMSVTETCCP